MSASIGVRPVLASDADLLFEFAADFTTSFSLDRESFIASLHALLVDDDVTLLCGVSGAAIVGYVLAFTHTTFFANGPVTWVEEIYVQPEWRRRGIASAMMRAVESDAKNRSSRLIALATRRADSFYRALGYEESATYYRRLLG